MAALEQFLGKKFKHKSSENFGEYLKFQNIDMATRKTLASLSPVECLLKNEDGTYTMVITTLIRNSIFTFRPGEEFEEIRLDCVKVKSTIVLNGDELIHTQVEKNGRKSYHVRRYAPSTLIKITTAEGWDGKCVRIYEIME